MIAVGFDPSFIDTILTIYADEYQLLEELPPPGHHHRINTVKRVAGGNGVNIAYVLNKLGLDIRLVVPSNDLFDALLKVRGLECDVRIIDDINDTVAVTWAPGEIQFNAVTTEMGKENWSREVHEVWQASELKLSTNWGLNPRSVEWISCQILASSGWSYEEINGSEDVYRAALQAEIDSKFVIETGSLKNHLEKEKLYGLLEHISSQKIGKIYPVILVNEEERVEFQLLSPATLIEHTSEQIIVVQNQNEVRYDVDKLECDHPNFVGAGDAFFAGIINSLVNDERIEIMDAIEVAQRYICGEI